MKKFSTSLLIFIMTICMMTSCVVHNDAPVPTGSKAVNTESTSVTTEKEITVGTTEEQVTADTTLSPTPAETLSEEAEQQIWKAHYNIDGVDIYCGEYDIQEFREEFSERILRWRKNNDIISWAYDCGIIDDCIVISAFSGEFAGNTQTSYVIVDCGDRIIEIDASEIMNISPIYFIENDVLYCYNDHLAAGNYHYCFSEFSLVNGEKINEYSEVYSLGTEDDEHDPISTYEDINSLDDLKSYICSISPQWYRLENMIWEPLTPIEKDGCYTTPEDVAEYIHTFGTLPDNFITKSEAKALGWDSSKGNLWDVAPGKSIGGDHFGNYEGLLPTEKGRKYTECDVNYDGGYRGGERVIFSNDGLIFYTDDHYETFTQLY